MFEPDTLADLIQNLDDIRVLCVGDVMLDQYVMGKVERVSPEAPIPVLRIDQNMAMGGGAGNVAANIVSLGANVDLVSVIGGDDDGRELRDLLGSNIKLHADLIIEESRATTTKMRFISEGQHLLRADREDVGAILNDTAELVFSRVCSLLPNCDAVILSDYGKGVLTESLTVRIIREARKYNRPIVVDPSGRCYARYRGSTVITPNRYELSLAANRPCENAADILQAASEVITRNEINNLLVTRSEEGMSLVSTDGTVIHLQAKAHEVFDVSGAGDTVVAVIGTILGRGGDLSMAAKLANYAAGIVVSKVGTATITISELENVVYGLVHRISYAKICSLEDAKSLVEHWKAEKLRVGFTNGAFDLLHAGHLASLKHARDNCERLIVAVNSDRSIKTIKGPARPIQGQETRVQLLASLRQVDLVVLFDELTPLKLVEQLRPDILVKGADYRLEEVIGADLVLSCGGRVLLTPLLEGHSTTNVVEGIVGGERG